MSIVAIASKYLEESGRIAEYAALRLGYRLITMDDLVQTVAKDHAMPEKALSELTRGLTLRRYLFRRKRLKLLSLLEQKLCEFMANDGMVFCGYVGYPIFREVSHVLKVLVLAQSEPGRSTAANAARERGLLSNDRVAVSFERIYHAKMEDPNLYDLTINLWHMDASEAGDIIINTLKQKRFEPMTYSMNCMGNLDLACQVRTALVDRLGDVEVKSHDGSVYIYSNRLRNRGRKAAKEVKENVMRMPGVRYVEVYRERLPFDEIHI